LRARPILLTAACVAAVSLAGLAAPAGADQRIVAVPVHQYATPNVTISQGEALFFRNLDLSQHDVVAHQRGPDGKPLFSTPLIGAGAEAAVEGAQSLVTGRYDFLCTIHSNMRGALTVSSAGSPRPGGSGGGDAQAPAVQVRILDSSASKVRRSRRLRIRIQTNEAARVELNATARRGRRPVSVARGSHEFSGARSATLALPLTRAGRRAVRARRTVQVSSVARDQAGNQGSATTRRRMRR
jgi:plastocyanin